MNTRFFIALVVLAALAGGYWFFTGRADGRCLKGGERAVYEVSKKGSPATVRVSVLDAASTTVWSRDVQIPDSEVFDPVTLGNCHFYAAHDVNYDNVRHAMLEDYRFGVWRFAYASEKDGDPVVISYENKTGKTQDGKYYYGMGFSVDPSETYIAIVRSMLEKSDYALVVKNINTGKDEYVLLLDDILKQHPRAAGSLDAFYWIERPDGVYLIDTPYDGAHWSAIIYIKRGTWETRIYDTPKDYISGVERSAPPFAPYLAYTDFIDWTGIKEGDDAVFDSQVAEGKTKKRLILADLTTGATTTITTVPIIKGHKYNPTWLDDSRLEYTMPDGSKRMYRIESGPQSQ